MQINCLSFFFLANNFFFFFFFFADRPRISHYEYDVNIPGFMCRATHRTNFTWYKNNIKYSAFSTINKFASIIFGEAGNLTGTFMCALYDNYGRIDARSLAFYGK